MKLEHHERRVESGGRLQDGWVTCEMCKWYKCSARVTPLEIMSRSVIKRGRKQYVSQDSNSHKYWANIRNVQPVSVIIGGRDIVCRYWDVRLNIIIYMGPTLASYIGKNTERIRTFSRYQLYRADNYQTTWGGQNEFGLDAIPRNKAYPSKNTRAVRTVAGSLGMYRSTAVSSLSACCYDFPRDSTLQRFQ